MSRLFTIYDDKDPLNNVMCALSLNVNEVYYFYHHEDNRNSFDSIKKVLRQYKHIKPHFIKLENDRKELQTMINKYKDAIYDVGGAKYLSLLLFELVPKEKNKIFYFDDEENVIKDYITHNVYKSNVFKLSIEDILLLKGGKIKHFLHEEVKSAYSKKIIVDVVENNIDNYPTFVKYITKVNSILSNSKRIGKRVYLLNEEKIKNITTDSTYKKAKGLFEIHHNRLTFKNDELRNMVCVSGAFLENYLYIKLKETKKYDELRMSTVIDFSSDKYTHPVRCEIDCLVLSKNRLAFVSCKSSKADTMDLNEIYVHNSIFGNSMSVPVLFIGEELDHKYPSIYAKSEELGVYVIDKSNIIRNETAEIFNKIFDGTYKYDVL